MGASTSTIEDVPNGREAAAALRTRGQGPLLLPGDSGYDAARAVWNAMIDRRPALIVRCHGVADVVACVNAAREHRVAVSEKGWKAVEAAMRHAGVLN